MTGVGKKIHLNRQLETISKTNRFREFKHCGLVSADPSLIDRPAGFLFVSINGTGNGEIPFVLLESSLRIDQLHCHPLATTV